MNAVALGPILILLGVIVGVVALVAAVAGRRKGRGRGAGAFFATTFGLLFLGSILLALLTYRVAPSAPQAVIVSSASTSTTERIVPAAPLPLDETAEAEAARDSQRTEALAKPKKKNQSTVDPASEGKSPKVKKTVTLYGKTKRAVAARWPQQLLSVAILMVMACLMKVVANGRLGRRFSTIARVGAGMLVCVLALVVWELGPIHF